MVRLIISNAIVPRLNINFGSVMKMNKVGVIESALWGGMNIKLPC